MEGAECRRLKGRWKTRLMKTRLRMTHQMTTRQMKSRLKKTHQMKTPRKIDIPDYGSCAAHAVYAAVLPEIIWVLLLRSTGCSCRLRHKHQRLTIQAGSGLGVEKRSFQSSPRFEYLYPY